MYTIAAASTQSEQVWSAFLAMRILDEAADVVGRAAALAASLSRESRWHNDGLSPRALRDALEELHGSIMGVLSDVREAHSELERRISA